MSQAPLNDIKVPISSNKYNPVTLDNSWGETVTINLYQTDLVISYLLAVTLGSLSGGTSPAWNVSSTNPVIAHVTVKYDQDTIYDADVPLIQEYNKITRGNTPNGLSFVIDIADFNLKTKKYFMQTGFPTWRTAQAQMIITLPSLGSITTGTPTSSSGTTLYMTERVVRRGAVTWPLLLVKHSQVTQPVPLVGANDLVNFLARVGAYKDLLLFSSTAQGYSSGSDSLLTDLQLKLNKQIVVFDEYWANLKQENLYEFNISPDSGYAIKTFMKDDNLMDMLYLGDTNVITEVDLHVSSTGTGYLTAFEVQYM